MVQRLHDVNDALGAIVRDLVSTRDRALADAVERLRKLADAAEQAGLPLVLGDTEIMLRRLVGSAPVASANKETIESLTQLLALEAEDWSSSSEEEDSDDWNTEFDGTGV